MADREKLIELIVEIENEIIKAYPYTTDQFRIEETANYLLANGVTMQNWIPVTERLPKDDSPVLVHESKYSEAYGNMQTAYYNQKRWMGCISENVTHWMPLPETPKVASTKIYNCSQEQPILQIKLKQDKPENWVIKEDLSLYEKIGKQYNIEQSSCKSYEHSYVEPVRHGEWEHDTCSICGAEWFDWTNMRPFATNYCPSCGAKMEGGKEFQ